MNEIGKNKKLMPKRSDSSVPGVYIIKLPGLPYFFIGSTSNLYRRESMHRSQLNRGVHENPKLQQFYVLEKGIEFNIIKRSMPMDEVFALERELRDQHKDNPYCLNMTSAESNEKMRKTHLGTTRSEETRRRMSEALKGRKGTPHSEESKQLIREARIGTTRSEKTKEKMRRTAARVLGKSITIVGQTYASINEASRTLGVTRGTARWLAVAPGVTHETVRALSKNES